MAVSTSLTSLPETDGVSRANPALAREVRLVLGPEAASLVPGGDPTARYWRGFLELGASTMAANLNVACGVAQHDGIAWPVTLSAPRGVPSYPCSLLTQYVRYPLEELRLVPERGRRLLAWMGLILLSVVGRASDIEAVVQWNSLLLSTNLPASGMPRAIQPITDALGLAFPRRAILVKNVDSQADSSLPARFTDCGYELITSRQVYYFDGRKPAFLAKDVVKRDLKAAREQGGYAMVEHGDLRDADVPRIRDLYHQLYVKKHSALNPQYTERFVGSALREGWLEFRGLRHPSGRLDGVLGAFTREQITSTPFIGYDTSLSLEAGLYRRMVCMLLERVAERGLLLNYSSGAGEFKRRRGGVPVIEFNAIYTRHLPPRRRMGYALLAKAANGPGRGFLESNKV